MIEVTARWWWWWWWWRRDTGSGGDGSDDGDGGGNVGGGGGGGYRGWNGEFPVIEKEIYSCNMQLPATWKNQKLVYIMILHRKSTDKSQIPFNTFLIK